MHFERNNNNSHYNITDDDAALHGPAGVILVKGILLMPSYHKLLLLVKHTALATSSELDLRAEQKRQTASQQGFTFTASDPGPP